MEHLQTPSTAEQAQTGFSQPIEHSESPGFNQGPIIFDHSSCSPFQPRLYDSLAQFNLFGLNVSLPFASSSILPSTVPLSSVHGFPLLPQAPNSELEPISELAQKRRVAQAHCANSSLYKEPGLKCILAHYLFDPSKTEYPQKVHSAPKYPKKLYVAWFRKNLKGKVSDADRQWEEWGEMETKVELAEWKLCLERIRREQSEQLKLGMIEI